MDAFAWGVVGSVAGAVGAVATIVFGLIPLLRRKRQVQQGPGEAQDDRVSPAHGIAEAVPGRPLKEVTNPFVLEVKESIQPEDPPPGLPALPMYVARECDEDLAKVVQAAAEGCSQIAVLVGGSSTGKTRACWEALQLLRNQPEPWRLWHPIFPTYADAALRGLDGIKPRTVVWLNDAQFYLDTAEGGRVEVAAGLREKLQDPTRAPVLLLATLWPSSWGRLTIKPTAGSDLHAQARELLTNRDVSHSLPSVARSTRAYIEVPSAFTDTEMQQLSKMDDVRLAQAAAMAEDGQVTQFLAGALELLARYRIADVVPKALIHAAMDARRLGMGQALPLAFLEEATPGYLTGAERDVDPSFGEGWLERALAYTAQPCKGVRGPVTRIRSSPASSCSSSLGARHSDTRRPDSQASITGGPMYRLADYLDQHGRAHRNGQFPPASFWAAAARYAVPWEQARLGYAARGRGLYRDAAQLYKSAAGNVSLDDVRAVSELLREMWEAGADHQAAGLAARAAAHVPLDDPRAVGELLGDLWEAGARQPTILLGKRVAANVSFDNPFGFFVLLAVLRHVGADQQAKALVRRTAANAYIDNPGAIGLLLAALQKEDTELAIALADRATTDVSLGSPGGVARLLAGLREVGADQQLTTLLHRDPAAHVSLHSPNGVAELLTVLREVGADQQATALLRRDPAGHVSLNNPRMGVAQLLDALRKAGAEQQATALADRAAANVSLGNPRAAAELLSVLREEGATKQATALADRAAANVSLDDASGVAWLLSVLHESSATQQATALADRAAANVSLDDPEGTSEMLRALREACATQQGAVLLRRDPAAHASLDNPLGVAFLLAALRKANAEQQVTALLRRDPAGQVSLEEPSGVAALLDVLREAGAEKQAAALLLRDPAAHVSLDPWGIEGLLDVLREAGAEKQATALSDRLQAEGMFWLFRELLDRQNRFRFGREADGSAAEPWSWDELD